MAERDLINDLLMRASEFGARLFRNNSGVADYRGVKVRYGVANPGGSDLIGITPVVVTPDMLGKTVGVFTAYECKTGKLTTTKDQARFIEMVRRLGGIAKVVRDPSDIERVPEL